jgi:hypothetical protein
MLFRETVAFNTDNHTEIHKYIREFTVFRLDDGGSKYLWNFGPLLRDSEVQHPRRLSSSYLPPWEPEISRNNFPLNSFLFGYFLLKIWHIWFFSIILA